MSDGRKYYCFCDSNCKFETMTKEQILAAIAQAVATGKVGDCDTGFITKVKETNSGRYVTFWVGTQAQYNALDKIENNCMYIITDDTTNADLLQTVEQMARDCASVAETVEQVARIAEEKVIKGDDGEINLIMRKYTDGTAEGFQYVVINNVPFTEKKGDFYAMYGGAKRLPFASQFGLTAPPRMVNISVDSVSIDGTGVAPNAFVMQGNGKDEVGTPNFVLVADGYIEKMTVRLVVHIVWEWK